MQLITTILLALATAASALPAVGSSSSPNPNVLQSREEQQQPPYTGPCEHTNCGADGIDCRAPGIRKWCVPYPTTLPEGREGCTCSSM